MQNLHSLNDNELLYLAQENNEEAINFLHKKYKPLVTKKCSRYFRYLKNKGLDFEDLVQGKSIIKSIIPELTYRDMDEVNNIYSFLLFTGYLKIQSQIDRSTYELVVPNKEVSYILEDSYMRYFNEIKRDHSKELLQYLKEERVEEANQLLNEILMGSISFYDSYEYFYHGFMTGLLINAKPISNREAGDGRFDLAVLTEDYCIVLEFKISKSRKEFKADSQKALQQIIEQQYVEGLEAEGYENITAYGISFFHKRCFITKLS